MGERKAGQKERRWAEKARPTPCPFFLLRSQAPTLLYPPYPPLSTICPSLTPFLPLNFPQYVPPLSSHSPLSPFSSLTPYLPFIPLHSLARLRRNSLPTLPSHFLTFSLRHPFTHSLPNSLCLLPPRLPSVASLWPDAKDSRSLDALFSRFCKVWVVVSPRSPTQVEDIYMEGDIHMGGKRLWGLMVSCLTVKKGSRMANRWKVNLLGHLIKMLGGRLY